MPAEAPPSAAVRPARYRYRLGDGAAVEVVVHEPAPTQRPVPEMLVHDLWQAQRFQRADLRTSDGRSITILDPGRLNTNGGPDFRAARLRIGDLEWGGDVEIHTTSSDWFAHGHHQDAHYNATVLHVTLHADVWTGGLLRPDGTLLPELVLYPHLEDALRTLLYDFYTRAQNGILCAGRWAEVPEALRRSWIRRLARERVDEKTARLAQAYLAAPDLEALLHERLFAGLGYAPNAEPMADLARRLPLSLVRTLGDVTDIEALHLGTAGLLPEPPDLLESDRASADYAMDLRARFARLRAEHDIAAMEKTSWQFFRLRPANFPPLRIAQAAALVAPGGLLRRDPLGALLHALADADPVAALRKTLGSARPPAFWDEHVRLEKKTKPRDPSIGRQRVDTLLVNTALPVLLLHAEQSERPGLAEAVRAVLEKLPAGSGDRVTRRFAKLGTRPKSALEAQGLHQLYRTRCEKARCLQCAVGRFLLEGRNE